MPRLGLALLLAACWAARGLHLADPQPAPRAPPSTPWRDELRSLASGVRMACGAGDAASCANITQKLRDHVFDQLKEEALKIQVSDIKRPTMQAEDGNGLRVRMPACVNGNESQEAPEFAYRHVPKVAGYQIMMNLKRFAMLKYPRLLNFPSQAYAEYNENKDQRPNSTLIFTFARNPVTRFVSGYAEMEDLGNTRDNNLTRGTAGRALEFVRGLLRHGFYNYHISPQVHFHLFHYEHGNRPFDFIGRLEDMATGWHHLEDMSNCSGKLGPWNSNCGGHDSSHAADTRNAMNDVVGNHSGSAWNELRKPIEDHHLSAWLSLGIDKDIGFDDACSIFTNMTRTKVFHSDSLAMRDLLRSSGGIALQVVCLLLLPDFYVLSYPLPSGCKHLDV